MLASANRLTDLITSFLGLTGSAHRLGQTRDVKIYKLTVDNTIETRLLKLQARKAAVADAALAAKPSAMDSTLAMDEVLSLFPPGADGL